MSKEDKNSVDIVETPGLGTVQIADDVVAVICAIAASEVDGVSSKDSEGNELSSKALAKGVKLNISGGEAVVDIKLMVDYGFNIPATCAKVQDKIKSTVENMTGLKVTDVNVRITGVEMQKD